LETGLGLDELRDAPGHGLARVDFLTAIRGL
jgi:hypothetical protein